MCDDEPSQLSVRRPRSHGQLGHLAVGRNRGRPLAQNIEEPSDQERHQQSKLVTYGTLLLKIRSDVEIIMGCRPSSVEFVNPCHWCLIFARQ
jgi:hypothetical protein